MWDFYKIRLPTGEGGVIGNGSFIAEGFLMKIFPKFLRYMKRSVKHEIHLLMASFVSQ